MPSSSSTLHGLFTWPEIQNTFGPEFRGRPIELNHAAPRRMMVGATAMLSTLLTVDGQPYSPTAAGNGGFSRGRPFLPSRLSSSPVSSPQIYAPAPRWRYTSKSQPEPHAFLPINPASYASSSAACSTRPSL